MSASALLEIIATLCAGLFAGAAVYVTFVEHPARLHPDLDVRSDAADVLLRRWGRLHAVRSLLGTFAFAILLRHLAIAAK